MFAGPNLRNEALYQLGRAAEDARFSESEANRIRERIAIIRDLNETNERDYQYMMHKRHEHKSKADD